MQLKLCTLPVKRHPLARAAKACCFAVSFPRHVRVRESAKRESTVPGSPPLSEKNVEFFPKSAPRRSASVEARGDDKNIVEAKHTILMTRSENYFFFIKFLKTRLVTPQLFFLQARAAKSPGPHIQCDCPPECRAQSG